MDSQKKSSLILAIDTGTTNTRICVLDENRHCLADFREAIGVRNCAIEGNANGLKATLRRGIETVLQKGGFSLSQISAVFAGGMLTSNVGIREVPHLTAPVGLSDLVSGIQSIQDSAICDCPIYLVPGVKNVFSSLEPDAAVQMDMMRGEELETFALLSELQPGKSYLFILPGSHTKFVFVDSNGKITGCATTMSGEILAALTFHTILADTVDGFLSDPDAYDRGQVQKGYDTAARFGLSRAAFLTRVFSQFEGMTADQAANFLLGAVLENDWQFLREKGLLSEKTDLMAVVAGKFPFRQAWMDLASKVAPDLHLTEAEDPGELSLLAQGIWLIAQEMNLF